MFTIFLCEFSVDSKIFRMLLYLTDNELGFNQSSLSTYLIICCCLHGSFEEKKHFYFPSISQCLISVLTCVQHQQFDIYIFTIRIFALIPRLQVMYVHCMFKQNNRRCNRGKLFQRTNRNQRSKIIHFIGRSQRDRSIL